VPVERALQDAMSRYGEVRARFPDKKIVIGEIGWPSAGFTVDDAQATPDKQARFVREFLNHTLKEPLDFYLMEAVDQPWKAATEGRVGAHWGFLNANRQPKFSMTGPLEADPHWRQKAAASAVLALIPLLPFLFIFSGMTLSGRFTFAVCVQAVATFAVLLGTQPLADYLRWFDMLLLGLLVPALMLMGAILLSQALEFAELFWHGSLHRVEKAAPVAGDTLPDGSPLPLVSIHLACCNEPPEMVLATVKSLLALDWPRLEIIVVDNRCSSLPMRKATHACTFTTCRSGPATRPARSTTRSNTPTRRLAGSAWSMPTTSWTRSGCASWPGTSALPMWPWSSRPRLTANGQASAWPA
jgi:hypothetical protein